MFSSGAGAGNIKMQAASVFLQRYAIHANLVRKICFKPGAPFHRIIGRNRTIFKINTSISIPPALLA